MSNNGLIYKKMSLVMAEIGAITKDQKNQQQGFKFRGIDQFVNAMYPALVKHGVFMAPKVVSESHELKEVVRGSGKAGIDKHVHLMVEYAFYAEDGSSVLVGPIAAEGLDSGDKATNKALSAALKYALIQTFSVPTEDMAEADLDTPEIAKGKTWNVATTVATELTPAAVTALNSLVPIASPVVDKPAGTSFRPPKKKAVESILASTPSNGGGTNSSPITDGWD